MTIAIHSKDFLTKKALKVDYKRIQSFTSNKSIKYSLNYLQNNYGLINNSTLSLKDIKTIFFNMIDKFKTKLKKDNDIDKYQQRGINKFYNKLKKFFNKVWARALSIICSVTANILVYVLGYFNFQSLMIALVLGGLYTTITFSIKYYFSQKNGTNMFYEPSNTNIPKMNSVVDFVKFIGKFIKDTIGKVFNWFFYEIDKTDSKEVTIRYRRWILLSIIVILLLILMFI